MPKVFGNKEDYAPVRQDASRIIVSYDIVPAEDGEHYLWREVYFNKKQNSNPSLEQMQEAVFADINEQAKERIQSGFKWKDLPVWLSAENQANYKAAADLAHQTKGKNLPVTFKFGTPAEPAYVTFDTVRSLLDFWTQASRHINDTLAAAWHQKDTIDWTKYKPLNQ